MPVFNHLGRTICTACGGLWRPVAACGGLWRPVAACGGPRCPTAYAEAARQYRDWSQKNWQQVTDERNASQDRKNFAVRENNGGATGEWRKMERVNR